MVSKLKIAAYLKGLVSIVPGSQYLVKMRGTRDTIPASYYYGIWLKHLTLAWQSGHKKIPKKVVEFGPGDCFGVGIAAMLSGADEYYGLDVIPYSNVTTNLRIFREMVQLFRQRAPRPLKGWPDFDKHLNSNLFPDHILTDQLLSETLNERRLNQIEEAIINPLPQKGNITFKYIVPWAENNELQKNSIDFCYSHSVLEYVTNLPILFEKIYDFLKPGALMSHQIDLSGHNVSPIWNGHRGYSELSWKLIKGKRPYFLTRNPYSVYKNTIKNLRFDIICDLREERGDGLSPDQISNRWKNLSLLDLNTSGAFIQAIKS